MTSDSYVIMVLWLVTHRISASFPTCAYIRMPSFCVSALRESEGQDFPKKGQIVKSAFTSS